MKYLILFLMPNILFADSFLRDRMGNALRYCKLPIEIEVLSKDKFLKEEVIYAINNWNKSTNITLFKLKQNAENTVEISNNWNRGVQVNAYTTTQFHNICIDASKIYLNPSNNYYTKDPKNSKKLRGNLNIESLLLHELGHTLGLADNMLDKNSIMYYILDYDEYKFKIPENDIKKLNELYRREDRHEY